MRGAFVLFAVGAILIGAAVGAITLLWRSNTAPAEVEVVPATETAVEGNEVKLPGIVVAMNVVGIPAPVEGTLESVAFTIGEEVYEGDLLGHIRNTTFESELAQARRLADAADERVRELDSRFLALRLESSRSTDEANQAREAFQDADRAFLRSQELLAKGAVSRQQHEKTAATHASKNSSYEAIRKVADANDERVRLALNELDGARAILSQAQEELENVSERSQASDVISPTFGVLAGVSTRAGEEVHPEAGDLFLIAADLSRLAVQIDPNPDIRAALRTGQTARVFLAELPGGSTEGIVTVQGNRILVEFISPTTRILPGLKAQVTVWLG